MAIEVGDSPVAIVPVGVKTPVVASMVYIETLPFSVIRPICHVGELARRIHSYGDRVYSCGDRPYKC